VVHPSDWNAGQARPVDPVLATPSDWLTWQEFQPTVDLESDQSAVIAQRDQSLKRGSVVDPEYLPSSFR
jgi:hypothetical protein